MALSRVAKKAQDEGVSNKNTTTIPYTITDDEQNRTLGLNNREIIGSREKTKFKQNIHITVNHGTLFLITIL